MMNASEITDTEAVIDQAYIESFKDDVVHLAETVLDYNRSHEGASKAAMALERSRIKKTPLFAAFVAKNSMVMILGAGDPMVRETERQLRDLMKLSHVRSSPNVV